jgi:protein gp37
MAHRFHRDFTPHWVEKNFNRAMPKKPSRIFINSMSDVAQWEPIWLARVIHRIAEHPRHLFLFLTKEPDRAPWDVVSAEKNALLGVTVTDQLSYDQLVSRTSPRNFLSIEPLLGPVHPWGIHKWIIVGAETGNRKERVVPKKAWLDEIWTYSKVHRIPLFFKDSLRSIWPSCLLLSQEYPA